MYALSGTRLLPGPPEQRTLELFASDAESLLVSFLSELLYFGEQEGLGFDSFELQMKEDSLRARLAGAPIASQDKEIKAVTYHNLAIRQTGRDLEANIVFDV